MARPNIPSYSFMRKFGGKQLLSYRLVALWSVDAFPAKLFVRQSPAYAFID